MPPDGTKRNEGYENTKKQGSFGRKFLEVENVVEMLGKAVRFLEDQIAPFLEPVQPSKEQRSITPQESDLAPVANSLEAIRVRIRDIIKVIADLTARLAF